MKIRKIRLADLISILTIESLVFGKAAWTATDFEEALADGGCGWVITKNGVIVGYTICMIEPFSDHAEILNLAVSPGMRRRGIAAQLMGVVQRQCGSRPVHAYVRETNVSMQCLLRSCGYRVTRNLRNQYEGLSEDQYLMECRPTVSAFSAKRPAAKKAA